jgi:MoxR-like ATPase
MLDPRPHTPTEPVQFKSPTVLHEDALKEAIKAKHPNGDFVGGIVAEEILVSEGETPITLLHIGDPYEENPTIITLPTRATKEEIDALRDRIIPTQEAAQILSSLATAYTMRCPLLIEGPTSIGKTYLIEKFTELLYGPGAEPLRFYCSGQTDVSELIARWVPRTDTPEERALWESYLSSHLAQTRIGELSTTINEESVDRSRMLRAGITNLAREAGLSLTTQWELQLGAVPRAMMGALNEAKELEVRDQGGHGYILDIEEVGLAKPQVINALLRLRGEQGEVARSIQLWEHGGKRITAGPDYWFVMSTNPPEEYLDRNEIDPALARGVIYLRMGEVQRESFDLAARRYLSYSMGNRPETLPPGCLLPLYEYPAVCKELAEILGSFHKEFADATKFGEPGRQQRIPVTFDDLAKAAKHLLYFQVRSPLTQEPDLPETIRRAVRLCYLDRLADRSLKKRMTDALEQTLTGDIGRKEFRGHLATRSKVLETLVHEIFSEPEDPRRTDTSAHRLALQAAHEAEDELRHLKEGLQSFDIKSPIVRETLDRLRLDPPE